MCIEHPWTRAMLAQSIVVQHGCLIHATVNTARIHDVRKWPRTWRRVTTARVVCAGDNSGASAVVRVDVWSGLWRCSARRLHGGRVTYVAIARRAIPARTGPAVASGSCCCRQRAPPAERWAARVVRPCHRSYANRPLPPTARPRYITTPSSYLSTRSSRHARPTPLSVPRAAGGRRWCRPRQLSIVDVEQRTNNERPTQRTQVKRPYTI